MVVGDGDEVEGLDTVDRMLEYNANPLGFSVWATCIRPKPDRAPSEACRELD